MKLYIDEREHGLYQYLSSYNLNLHKEVLPLGDLILKTEEDQELIIIERKTITDLLASINDGRYREQSHRLIHSSSLNPHRILYIIEGVFQGQTPAEKQRVYSAIVSLNQIKGFSVYRTWSMEETGDVLVNMADKLQREMDKGHFCAITEMGTGTSNYCDVVKKVKKDNLTPENMGAIMLSQIPSVSSVSAKAMMTGFSSFSQFLNKIREEPNYLESIVCGEEKKRKLGKNIIENVKRFLLT